MTEHADEPVVTSPTQPATAQTVLPPSGEEDFEQLGGPDWPTETVATTFRFRKPTAILLVLMLLAVGFWAGITVEKNEGSSSASGFPGRAAFSALSGTRGSSAARSLFGSLSNSTTGTVTDIIGKTLYVTNSSGALVKVTVGSSTTVSRNAKSSLSGLKPGDTVVVSGVKTGTDQVTASSVSATAAGVSSTGGFP
ncbi:MAG: hypothetical protein ABSC56_13560 [Solirubrobacteraceae bacterium]|jgi:hypothetical protein